MIIITIIIIIIIIISECIKLAKNGYMTKLDWMGKVIHSRKLKFG